MKLTSQQMASFVAKGYLRLDAVVPEEINVAANDANGFGVVMMMFDTDDAVVPAAFDAFTTNVYL